jgi:hypothetical protein
MRTGDVILSDKTSWCANPQGTPPYMGGYAPAARARGRGGAGAGADAAPEIEGVDLRIALKVCVEDHVMYARVHDDLVVVKRLTLAEALTGCTMLLPHPSRRQLRVSTPVGMVVTPGQRLTVKGGEWGWCGVCCLGVGVLGAECHGTGVGRVMKGATGTSGL